MKLKTLSLVSVALLALTAHALGQGSSFYFISSPQSIVGRGDTVIGSSTNGFTFSATVNPNNGVSVVITDSTRTWNLDFAAADGAPLASGTYNGAQLWPNMSPGSPGLAFTMPGFAPSSIVGYFNVLNIQMGPGNVVQAFDADFLQYDNGLSSQWNQGSIRFAAVNPVPEPGTMALAAAGLLALLFSQRWRRRA